MNKFWLISCIAVLYVHLSNTFILPLKTPDGTLDTEHVVGHVTLLEQLVTTLQQTVTSQGKDISALTNEIASLKASQQKSETKISDLKTQIGTVQVTAEVTSLKGEVKAAKTDIRLVSSQLNNVTHHVQTLSARVNFVGSTKDPELKALRQKYQTLSSQVNSSGATRDVELKALGQKYQTLSSKVNSSGATRDVKLMALNQKYQTLSSKVNSSGATRDAKLKALDQKYKTLLAADKNMTVTVNDVQSTLARVLTEVHSAQTDRFLLHSDVTRLNKSITDTTMTLSAKIAQEHTEVGFESWGTSSTVTQGMILKFGNIQYNSGGGYSATTGKFTAPVSGTYLFWTQLRKYSGSHLGLYIYKTGAYIGYFYSLISGYETGSVITSTHLAAGQQVYVKIYHAQSIVTGYESRFGGILLYRH